MMEFRKKTLINWLGLLGIVSFLSYAMAVIFAPLAYPGYDWMSQAVSDLSAASAPSFVLWTRLVSLYAPAGMVCIMAVCIAVRSKLNKPIRIGIYLFAAMLWISTIGFGLFPLSESGTGGTALQDIIHIFVVTPPVIILSIVSLVLIMIGGYRKRRFVSLAVCATVALALMLAGAIGTGAAPVEYFGVFQRFSNMISVNGFLATLGIYLFMGKLDD